MSGSDLLIDEQRLFEELCKAEWLRAGFVRVKKNKGSPGIDGVTIAEFEAVRVGPLAASSPAAL